MSFKQKAKDFLEKARNWPDEKKKIVLWTIVSILAVILGIFWFISAKNRFLQLDDLGFPKVEMPDRNLNIQPATETLNFLQQNKESQ